VLRSLALVVGLFACVGCDKTDDADAMVGEYRLLFSKDESLLRHRDIQGSTLRLSRLGSFVQECIAGDGSRTELKGRWAVQRGKLDFSEFLDCAGAWPDDSTKGALLLYSAKPTPEIVVMPDLDVVYVAEKGAEPRS